MQEVLFQMNRQKQTIDPLIDNIVTAFDPATKIGINLDANTSNDYIFESVKAQTAIDEIIEREGNPVESGGSFEFFFFRFVSKYDHGTGMFLDEVQPSCFEQGFVDDGGGNFTNIPNETLTKQLLTTVARSNTLDLDTDLQTERGTNLIAIGDRSSGTYPIDLSRMMGAQEVFESAREWITANDYVVGDLVTFSPVDEVFTYECILDHTSNVGNDPTNGLGVTWVGPLSFTIPADWAASVNYVTTSIVNHNEIAYRALQAHLSSAANEPPNSEFWRRLSWKPTSNYSPLSIDKAQYWVNALGGYRQASVDDRKAAIVDANVIVKDDFHPRTWVDTVRTDPTDIPADLLISGQPFNGLRALVVNPTTGVEEGFGDWSGNDKNGTPFAGNQVEYQEDPLIPSQSGVNAQWVVINSSHPAKPATNQDQEIYDFEFGNSWIKEPCTSGFVNDVGVCSISRDANWVKGAYAIVGGVAIFQADQDFDCAHPVKFDSGNSRIDVGNEGILNQDTDVGTVLPGTATSSFFIKTNPTNVITSLFVRERFIGANFAFPWPRNANADPFGAVTIGEQIPLTQFDFLNMFQAQDEQETWIGPQVEDFYPIQGFDYFAKLSHQLQLVLGQPFSPTGDYNMAFWFSDRKDNIITIDHKINYNDEAIPTGGSISTRKIYRAVPGIWTFIPAREPEILDIFDMRQVVRGGIFSKDSYDGQGRYMAYNRFIGSGDIKLSIDAFRMNKPLITTNNDEPNDLPERNIEPEKLQYEKITSYSQLKNYVLAITQLYNFQTDAFNIQTPGRANIAFGDPVYYFDPEAVNETTDALGNTIKATAWKILYTVSKTADGPAGMLRDIELITRLYPE